MSKKFSASRKRAFLTYLAQSGNQTLSAERAAVSRSWVCLHRKDDAAFDAACVAAIRQAQDRLGVRGVLRDGLSTGSSRSREAAPAASFASQFPQDERRGSNKPPTGWGFLDGAELVVRGSGGRGGGRRVQIARARAGQWTARVEARFLAALGATCNVKASCAEVGKTHGSAYGHSHRWPAFAAQWGAAIADGYARLEMALVENGGNLFSDPELPPEIPPEIAMGPMTVAQAIHLLHMHKHAVRGIGKAPGTGWRAPPTLDELRPGIIRKLEAFERRRTMSDAERARAARDRAEWARRRGR